jgi:hypothetical protein
MGEVVDARGERPAGAGLDAPDLTLPGSGGERLSRSHPGVVGVEGLTPPGPPFPPGREHVAHDVEPSTPDERLRPCPTPGHTLGPTIDVSTGITGDSAGDVTAYVTADVSADVTADVTADLTGAGRASARRGTAGERISRELPSYRERRTHR